MQGFIITNIALERSLRLTNTIPRNATNVRFVVSVPGGGDYSNMDLSIGQGPMTFNSKCFTTLSLAVVLVAVVPSMRPD